ncbi:MAG: endolytic transglycosylase MltG, partial [Desulfobacterales bacterium]|nr:endolytic transglycosylase MltG [Desulfobacterales bacterium]
MKKIFIGATILFFILLVVLTGVCLDLYLYAEKPARSTDEEKTLALHPGQGLKAFAEILAREEIIVQPLKFKLLARFKGQDKRIKAGEYRLSGALSPTAILEKLVAGEVLLHKLTIPEGYNLRQIAKAAASQGFGSETAFYQAAADPELALKYEIDARTLEGYLFPDTYYFPRSVTPRKIIDSMVRRFWEVFKPAWKKRAAAMGLTVHEVVTLASIIEKETGVAFERPIISSVFYNRLKKGMRLETDPTVIYGIKNF